MIACAKYKASGRDRFEFELKWFVPLKDIFIPTDESIDGQIGCGGYAFGEVKENNPVNLLTLKSQASTVRDLILAEERDDKKHKLYSSRSMDKYRKKLHDIEGQLVLASPNLVFRIGNKTTNRISTFFLSSQYERNCWIDTIINLQESCNLPSAQQINLYDLQAWIAACQTFVKTEMGSYLMRNSRDESLLVGDLHLTVIGVSGFDKLSDLFCCVEVDSYGHYFRKATTKTMNECVNPQWNEYFLIELEGCENMRFLLYEETSSKPILRAEHVLKVRIKINMKCNMYSEYQIYFFFVVWGLFISFAVKPKMASGYADIKITQIIRYNNIEYHCKIRKRRKSTVPSANNKTRTTIWC